METAQEVKTKFHIPRVSKQCASGDWVFCVKIALYAKTSMRSRNNTLLRSTFNSFRLLKFGERSQLTYYFEILWKVRRTEAMNHSRSFLCKDLPFEVSCRGLVGGSGRRFSQRAGFSKRAVRKAVCECGEETAKASGWIMKPFPWPHPLRIPDHNGQKLTKRGTQLTIAVWVELFLSLACDFVRV